MSFSARVSKSLFVPGISKLSSAMWLREHIVFTRVEMDHLDPSFMDSGCKLSSLRSLHDNSSAMSSSFSGGEWHPHKTLEVKKKTKSALEDKVIAINLYITKSKGLSKILMVHVGVKVKIKKTTQTQKQL